MARLLEIYPRNPGDPLYQPGRVETEDPTEIIIGMLQQILTTKPGEVLGDPFFGIDLESLIFDFNVGERQLQEAISLQVYTYIPLSRSDIRIDFKVGFFRGETRDTCVIDFAIRGIPVLGIKIV